VLEQMAQGKNNAAIAQALVLTPRAVEKHINSIFSKLPLDDEPDVDRRVKAVLLFLSEHP
jgi:DNA-binding NarL/FixJ family response regulator